VTWYSSKTLLEAMVETDKERNRGGLSLFVVCYSSRPCGDGECEQPIGSMLAYHLMSPSSFTLDEGVRVKVMMYSTRVGR
jgi:hypothetical protein